MNRLRVSICPLLIASIWTICGCGSSSGGSNASESKGPPGRGHQSKESRANRGIAVPMDQAAANARQAKVFGPPKAGGGLDSATDSFPIRKGPLLVGQYLLRGQDELIVRVRPVNFLCGRTPSQRLTTVRAFYAQARPRLKAAGASRSKFMVGELNTSVSDFEIYAIARGNKIGLTRRGKSGGGSC